MAKSGCEGSPFFITFYGIGNKAVKPEQMPQIAPTRAGKT